MPYCSGSGHYHYYLFFQTKNYVLFPSQSVCSLHITRKKLGFCGLGFGCPFHVLRKASAAGLGSQLERVLGPLFGLLTQAGEAVQKVIEQYCSRFQNAVVANIKNMQNAGDILEKLKMSKNGHKHVKVVQEVS